MRGLWLSGLLLIVLSASFALGAHDQGGGLPDIGNRIELVEKVLEVEKLTKQPTLDLKGTDYQPGDEGKILAYVLEGSQPVTDALCIVSVLYPDHTSFIDNEIMFEFESTEFSGLYYHNFIVPNITGVYPVAAYCFYGTTTITDSPDEELGNLTESVSSEGIVSLSPNFEGAQEFQKSSFCNDVVCGWNWNISLPSGAISPFLTDFRIILRAHTDANENFKFFVKNFNTSIYENFANYSLNNPFEPTTAQYLLTYFENTSNYVKNNKVQIIMLVDDFDTTGKNMEVFDLYTSRTYNSTIIQDMRGSNEIVVSKAIYNQTINLGELLEADISVVPDEQIAQIIIIVVFFILIFSSLFIPASILGFFYSFIYLDGFLTIIGAGICALILFAGWRGRKK